MSEPIHTSVQYLTGHVLLVDDEPANNDLLADLLEACGHHVTVATSGGDALQKAAAEPPDVVLLDVMMAGMDGFEVCRRLKRDARTAPIPVLMVTALHERKERLRGIEAGANDYLTKPIDKEDVLLRVRNAIQVKRLHDRVQEELAHVKELEKLRDNLTHMIVHDMRSPLTVVSGSLELLHPELVEKAPSAAGLCQASMGAARELIAMCNGLLDISRLEAGQMPINPEPCDLRSIAPEAATSTKAQADSQGVTIHVEGPPLPVTADKRIFHRVLVNLLTNAIKHTPRGGRITIRTSLSVTGARIEVQDTGRGIPREYHEKIFEKFGQVQAWQKAQKHSSGLGLTFCKLAVQAHGGMIGVDSEEGKGSTFWFTMPLVQPT